VALVMHVVNVGLTLWYIFKVIRRKAEVTIVPQYEKGREDVIIF
jgi:hypothetical protein